MLAHHPKDPEMHRVLEEHNEALTLERFPIVCDRHIRSRPLFQSIFYRSGDCARSEKALVSRYIALHNGVFDYQRDLKESVPNSVKIMAETDKISLRQALLRSVENLSRLRADILSHFDAHQATALKVNRRRNV